MSTSPPPPPSPQEPSRRGSLTPSSDSSVGPPSPARKVSFFSRCCSQIKQAFTPTFSAISLNFPSKPHALVAPHPPTDLVATLQHDYKREGHVELERLHRILQDDLARKTTWTLNQEVLSDLDDPIAAFEKKMKQLHVDQETIHICECLLHQGSAADSRTLISHRMRSTPFDLVDTGSVLSIHITVSANTPPVVSVSVEKIFSLMENRKGEEPRQRGAVKVLTAIPDIHKGSHWTAHLFWDDAALTFLHKSKECEQLISSQLIPPS